MRLGKLIEIAGAAVLGITLLAVSYVYVASERIIERHYPLPARTVMASTAPGAAEHGRHLAAIIGCTDCHGADLNGAYIDNLGVRSPDIVAFAHAVPDAELDAAIRHGLRPDGTSLSENMPADAFQYMPDAYLTDLLAYLRSLTGEAAIPPAPTYGVSARLDLISGKAKMVREWFASQTPALDLGPATANGRSFAMTACGACHGTVLEGQGAGTPDATPDLAIAGAYDRAAFTTLMRTGKAEGDREVGLMSKTARARFSNLTDTELAALYDYLTARANKLAKPGG